MPQPEDRRHPWRLVTYLTIWKGPLPVTRYATARIKYSEDQPRDERGRFGESGGGAATSVSIIPRHPSDERWNKARLGRQTEDFRKYVRGDARYAVENFLNLHTSSWDGRPYPNEVIQSIARGEVVMETRTSVDTSIPGETYTDEFQAAVNVETGKEVDGLYPYGYEQAAADVVHIDDQFDKPESVLSGDLIVYRGVDASVIRDLGSGDKFTDKGYTSVALQPSDAVSVMAADKSQIGLEIFVPAGTHMITNDKDPDYQEGILPRGTTLRIVDEYTAEADYPYNGFDGLPGGGLKDYVRVMVVRS